MLLPRWSLIGCGGYTTVAGPALPEICCVASCWGYTDGSVVFIAAADFRIAAETQLRLTWVSIGTAIPLVIVDIPFVLTQFDQRRLRVSRAAGLHS